MDCSQRYEQGVGKTQRIMKYLGVIITLDLQTVVTEIQRWQALYGDCHHISKG